MKRLIDANHGLLAMVNESSFQSNSNLDVIAIATATISSLQPFPQLSLPLEQQQKQQQYQQENQHQQEYQQQQQQEEQSSTILSKSEQFSWKFFDNELTILEHLTGVQDENSSRDNIKYIINDEDDLSCQQQNLLIPKEDHFHLPIIMSSSKTINAIRQNHSQINNNNKNNNHNNNNKNNSNNNNISNNNNNNNNSIISNSINNNNNNNSSINTNGNSNNNTVNRLGGIGEADSNCSVGTSRAGTLFNYNLQGIEYATSTDAFYNNNTTTTQAAPSTTPTTIPFTRTQVQAATGQKLYDSRNINSMTGVMSFHLGLHGWRKKCLYVLILGLMLLIIINLILTLWILKVMEFSSEGMGQLKIVAGGIQLSGQALIMDLLRASAIRSRHGQPISIESSRNFSIYTRGPSGELENHLFLGHDKLECTAKEFRINDTHGNNLFSVNQKEVTIGAHTVKIDGEGGAVFRESIQTPHVRAEAGRELRLESPTRQLNIASAKELTLQTRAGSIEMISLDDIKLSSNEGGIRLDSSKIFLPNLRTAQPITTSGIPSTHDHSHRVYQLCACSNGKLFLAPPHSICAGDDSTVCR